MIESNQNAQNTARPTTRLSWASIDNMSSPFGRPSISFDRRSSSGRMAPLFDWHSTKESALFGSSEGSEQPSGNDLVPVDLVIKEINNEFKHLQGEPTYTFGRQPTPGLQYIRDAIRQNTDALIEKLKKLKADVATEETSEVVTTKTTRDTILEAQNKALECRISALEDMIIKSESHY